MGRDNCNSLHSTQIKSKKPGIKSFFENKTAVVKDEGRENRQIIDDDTLISTEETSTERIPTDCKVGNIEKPAAGKSFFAWKMESLKEDHKREDAETDDEVIDLETPTENTKVKDTEIDSDNDETPGEKEITNCQVESFSDVDLEELIPSLDTFDHSLLDMLPKELLSRAKERLKMLKDQKKPISSSSITSFLSSSPSSSSTDLLTVNDKSEEMVNCDQCGKKVSPFTLPEHLDWHFAISLSKQTQPLSTNNVMKTNKVQTQTSGKRKRVSVLGDTENSKKNCQREISNFFSRK